jgi:hypothetical protein
MNGGKNKTQPIEEFPITEEEEAIAFQREHSTTLRADEGGTNNSSSRDDAK